MLRALIGWEATGDVKGSKAVMKESVRTSVLEFRGVIWGA